MKPCGKILLGGKCGPCNVYLNGNLVKHAVLVDVLRGKVVQVRQPIVVNWKTDSVRRTTSYGVVEVVAL